MKLTVENIAAIVADKEDQYDWDDDMPGFGVRTRNGRKTYVAYYRVGRQQRKPTLGDVRKIKLADARKAAQRLFAQAELGVDPAAEKIKVRVAATAATLTLAIVTARYLAAKVDQLRPSTYRASKTYLNGHWKPLGHLPLSNITRADVAARLQEIIAENGRSAAHGARAKLSALFGWAMREGLTETNPTVNTNNPRQGAAPRDRVFTDREIAIIWRACADDASNGSDFGRVVKMLILTGCRREEIGGLRWTEIDENSIMTVPGSRTKNGQPLVLKLPPLALTTLPPRRDGRAFVFGQSGNGFRGWSYQTKCLLTRIAAANGPMLHWTLHDFRRTMRTGLSKLKVPSHIAELAIGHSKNGIEAVYDHHKYQAEIGDALAKWADHVASVVDRNGGNTVVPMRAA